MGLFSFLNKKNRRGKSSVSMFPVWNSADQPGEKVDDAATALENEVSESKPLTVPYATGWSIDIIYYYLHKNYEERGYGDSMVKSDLAFREMNMNIIKNKILMVFREINLNYNVMSRDIEFHIDACRAAGLISTLTELENRMSVIAMRKLELEQLEREFRANSEVSVPLQSYSCGFLRGIATIAIASSQGKSVTREKRATA